MTDAERARRKMRKDLRDFVSSVSACIVALDTEMKLPSSSARGGRIAKITNALEFARDCASHFGLGLPLKKAKRK